MSKSIFILGTDTDVGKTLINSMFTYKLKNENVISYKPVQSGYKEGTSDVDFVSEICDLECGKMNDMNTYSLKAEVSPHLASEMENVIIDKNKIINHFRQLKNKYEYIIVEGAGGTIVPLVRNKYYIYNLIKDLNIPIVVVASCAVGTINHTILTLNYLKALKAKVNGIIFNNYTGKYYEDDNIKTILEYSKIKNYIIVNKIENFSKSNIRKYFDENISIDKVKRFF